MSAHTNMPQYNFNVLPFLFVLFGGWGLFGDFFEAVKLLTGNLAYIVSYYCFLFYSFSFFVKRKKSWRKYARGLTSFPTSLPEKKRKEQKIMTV